MGERVRVERIEPVEAGARVIFDDLAGNRRDECPWCGDELRDGECSRRCAASRVDRMDGKRRTR